MTMVEHWSNVALPQLPDGRTFISDQMIAEDPALADLVRRGHNFWRYDVERQMWVSPTPGAGEGE